MDNEANQSFKSEELDPNADPNESSENGINAINEEEAEREKLTRRGRRKANIEPELRMSDKERRKREEMDRSSDQLIIALSPEQSDEEQIQLMKQFREMQKQEIIIEV
jgi:hypothetical protein